MSSGTINFRVSPRRMLSLKEAAEYCGLPVKRFLAECSVPQIVMPAGKKLYDIRDLDKWLDSLKVGAGESHDEIIGRLR